MFNMHVNLRRQIARATRSLFTKPTTPKKVWVGVAIAVLFATSASAQSLIQAASAIPAVLQKFEPPSPMVRFHFFNSNCEEYHA